MSFFEWAVLALLVLNLFYLRIVAGNIKVTAQIIGKWMKKTNHTLDAIYREVKS